MMIMKLKIILKDKVHFILSFFVPLLILILAYADFGIFPSSNKTILISDMEGQYIDFYTALYDIIKNGKSFLYSWKAGMGLNFVGIYAYYLASPFSLIILLFQRQHLTEALYYITLLKIGTAGFTFSLYLNYLYKNRGLSISLFSILYALMSYSIVYSFHIMWLDGIVFLPLVLLGTEKVIRESKPLLLVLSLALVFIANFYISYMVGVFSFLYFLVNFFSIYSFKSGRVFVRKLLLFTLSAVLAAGSAGFLLIPAYFALKNGPGMSNVPLFDWKINFNQLHLFSKLPVGSYDTLTEGLPNIYCGLLTLMVVPLYFTNRMIKLKEKLLYFSLILFLILGFSFSNLNLMWHGFDEPNWFPYRYSFLFSFLLINLAFRGFNALEKSQANSTLVIYGLWVIVLGFLKKQQYNYLTERALFISLLFFSIYGLLLWFFIRFHNTRRIILLALLFVISGENYINTRCLISSLDKEFKYASGEKYNTSLAILNNLVRQIKEKDKSFYKMDRTINIKRSFNDSMSLDYNGISHFSSMINGPANIFLNRLGFITPVTAAVDYAGATLITDSLLGVKYILSDRPRGFGYNKIFSNENIDAYENTYALPLGFLADKRLMNLKTGETNPFELQDEMLNLILGRDYNSFFSPLSVSKTKLYNLISSDINGKEEYKKIDINREAFVEFTIENARHQQVYGYLPAQIYSPVDVYINDSYLERYLHYYNNTIIDLGLHNKDEQLRVKLVLKTDSFTILNKYFYGLAAVEFDRAMEELRQGAFQIIEISDTYIKGKLDVYDRELLFTSIPFDPGWKVFADGNRAQVKKIGEAFIGIELPKGLHNVEFRYKPKGLREGIFISTASIILMFFFIKHKPGCRE